jgi:hypothetical protein
MNVLFLSIPGLLRGIATQRNFDYELAGIKVVFGSSARIFADRTKRMVGLGDEELVTLAGKLGHPGPLLASMVEILQEVERGQRIRWPRRRYRMLLLTWGQLNRFLEAQNLNPVQGVGLYSPETACGLVQDANPNLTVYA